MRGCRVCRMHGATGGKRNGAHPSKNNSERTASDAQKDRSRFVFHCFHSAEIIGFNARASAARPVGCQSELAIAQNPSSGSTN